VVQRKSREGLLPQFAKVKGMTAMQSVAQKLVIAKKAIVEIRAIEDKLLKEKDTTPQKAFVLAMRETTSYAQMVVQNAAWAISELKQLKPRILAYQRTLKNAVS